MFCFVGTPSTSSDGNNNRKMQTDRRQAPNKKQQYITECAGEHFTRLYIYYCETHCV